MSNSVKVGVVQMNSGTDVQQNLDDAAKLIFEAADRGAEFVLTPENTDFMRETPQLMLETAMDTDTHPGIPFFSALAKKLKINLLIGSMKIKVSNDKIANRSFLFSPTGQLTASYDKIHLFDVDLPTGETHRESFTAEPGDKAVVASASWGKVGMSICYDLRFPHLYREMAKREAGILAIPAAFTVPTGEAHWETLLRARAIENGCFVIAPAQIGKHEGSRETYGHSMIIDPWGKVLMEDKGNVSSVMVRPLNLLEVIKARRAIPSLQHDRKFSFYNE